MCGIAGLILSSGAAPPDPATLTTLIEALRHRGPDGNGQTVVGRVALLHNRLSIIDLVTGDQPLFAGHAALVANGEIYNYRELRAAMPGVAFATNSDCEPPLHVWLREGPDYARQLRGMYAIAIHERAQRSVTLTRDAFGIKPLYIAQVTGGLAFASEPQALLESELVARRVRASAREELLQLQFTTGADTIFEGIQRLLPGETLTCIDGAILGRRRVSAIPDGPPETITEDAALERLDRALMESVDLHQRSDVPYGMFLSGGIDSSTLITLMSRLNTEPVMAFTAGFDVAEAADERDLAATVARAVGARHESIEVTETMVWGHWPEIVAAGDAEREGTKSSPAMADTAPPCAPGGWAGGRCGRTGISTRWMCCGRSLGPGATEWPPPNWPRPRADAPAWPPRRPSTWPIGCRMTCY